ncbi:hypothetical protein F993_01474 [Acinetobacter proteolyticus]|uniref:Uncharacterized protein n=1 Tax=Acinetobacter proteolyticus TaxID=1776741 RepID=A0ABN0JG95_9GAMM|nr:hypothetical protein [Acinetobacter proteolyticus]ENU24158.1 hypothetical protein F993_01474 [Acinetobacter proteolyticus]
MGLLDEKEKLIRDNYVEVWKLIELLSNTDKYSHIGVYLRSIEAHTRKLPLYRVNEFYQIGRIAPPNNIYSDIEEIIDCLICDTNGVEEETQATLDKVCLKSANYYWKNSDLLKFKELKDILTPTQIVEVSSVEAHVSSTKSKNELNKNNLYISDILNEKKEKYSSFIYLIEDFCHTFDILIYELSSFLLLNGFESQALVYVNISKIDCIALDDLSSTKAIHHILNILSNKKFNSTRFENSFDDELMYEFGHIQIERNSLYSFKPLNDLTVNICSGHEVFGSAKYGDLNIKELNEDLRNYRQSQPEIFSDEWYDMYPKLKELRDVTPQEMPEAFPNLLSQHPALDANHPNHAPELKLAFELWEEIYVNGRYVESHSKSVEQLLCERGHQARSSKTLDLTNLAKRIIAITNKK